MKYESLSDLHELVFRVRDPRSQQLLSEAVEAYYGGAYRSCVMSIWVAITFDIMEKISELATYGDKQAQQYTKKIKKLVSENDVYGLSKCEQELLNVAANDFSLISREQAEQFERLRKDRNMCAHPTYTSDGQIFKVSPEMARMYISYAVLNLLSFGPVRGKSSLEAISVDVRSATFPKTDELAGKFLEEKYLKYARKDLVENFFSLMLKASLKDIEEWQLYRRNAIRALTGASFVQAKEHDLWMGGNLSKFCDGLNDKQVLRLFSLIIKDKRYWGWIGEQHRIQLYDYIKNLKVTKAEESDENSQTIWAHFFKAFDVFEKQQLSSAMGLDDLSDLFILFEISTLKPVLLDLFEKLSTAEQVKVISLHPCQELAPCAVGLYISSGSFRGAEHMGENVLLPIACFLNPAQVGDVLKGVCDNGQIFAAGGTCEILIKFVDTLLQKMPHPHVKEITDWKKFVNDLSEFYDNYDELKAYLSQRKLI